MTNPHDLHRRIMLACGTGDARLFRNNVGIGWVGATRRLTQGGILLLGARPLHAGLCVGSSDLIGWRSVIIRPENVGRRLAVFVAIEAKTGGAVLTKEQRAFIAAVNKAGGIAGVAKSTEDAQRILEGRDG